MKVMMKMVIMTLVLWVGNVSMADAPYSARVDAKLGTDVYVDVARLFPMADETSSYEVYFNGKPVDSSNNVSFYKTVFMITNVSTDNQGVYTVIMRKGYGVYEARIAVFVTLE